jgi:hypothetical protein
LVVAVVSTRDRVAERVALQAQNDAVASQVRAATAWVTVNKAMGR